MPWPPKLTIEQLRSRLANREDSEHEQAFVRLAIGICLFAYFFYFYIADGKSAADTSVVIFMGAFILISIGLIVHIAIVPAISPARRLLAAVLDSGTTTYFFFNAAESAISLYFLYLWIIFGHGFRFGTRYLLFTLALSLTGFGAVIFLVPYWKSNLFLGVGLWIGMLLVSLYVNTLTGRLFKALQYAEAANHAKRRFISSVSHELRTPLNAIIGMADLLRGTTLNAEQKDMVRSLDNASRLMLSLIEDVLDFSKIEAGKIVIETTMFDLQQLVNSTVDIFKIQAMERGLSLTAQVPPEITYPLQGDPHHLRQVLVNLLSNAIKFTEKGSVTLRITELIHFESRSLLRFEVEDTGIGISPAAQAKIFESFTQAEESTTRRYGGTGLGTTISKQLVELMGGALQVKSEPGIGSTFWFDLNLEKSSASASQKVLSFPTVQSPVRARKAHYRVLVAEDNPTNRMILEKVLQREGHFCTLVQNGEEALERLEQEAFDVAVFDMNMPVMGGLDAAKALRYMQPVERRTPIIMFSANVTKEAREECFAAGVDEFVPKPIQVNHFLETLDRLVEKFGFAEEALPPARQTQPAPIHMQPNDGTVLLNYATLAELESIGQDPAFVDNVITGFIEDNRTLIQRLEESLVLCRFEESKDILHAIKGSSSSIGAEALRITCGQAEGMTHGELQQNTEQVLDMVSKAFIALCSALDEYRRSHLAPN